MMLADAAHRHLPASGFLGLMLRAMGGVDDGRAANRPTVREIKLLEDFEIVASNRDPAHRPADLIRPAPVSWRMMAALLAMVLHHCRRLRPRGGRRFVPYSSECGRHQLVAHGLNRGFADPDW